MAFWRRSSVSGHPGPAPSRVLPSRTPAQWLVWLLLTPVRVVARLPFSLAMLVAIEALAHWSGSVDGGLARDLRERYGYDLENLRHGHLWVLVTSEVFTGYPAHVRNTIEMVLVWLVPYEWLAGTWRTLVAYWVGTSVGTGLAALLSLLMIHAFQWDRSPDLVTGADVGASVGAWAVAGALSATLIQRGPVARVIGMGLPVYGIFYLGDALTSRWGVSDYAHPIGLATGIVVGALVARPTIPSTRRPAWLTRGTTAAPAVAGR